MDLVGNVNLIHPHESRALLRASINLGVAAVAVETQRAIHAGGRKERGVPSEANTRC